MVGCYIIMFVKNEHKMKIRNIRKFKVKSGLKGFTGNKGSVALRFTFEDTSFAFINAHLESGQGMVAERLENIRQIYNDTFNDFSVSITQDKCFHDYKCFFGDLNFRVDLPNPEVRALIEQGNYTRLKSQDQLLKARSNNKILSMFHEGPLDFDPTYKYDFNCNVYDTSQKNRIPGWCDRILLSRDNQMQKLLIHDPHGTDERASKPIYYNRRENFFSDHRPVLAVYRMQVIKIDESKR